jgi:hypothetical protein
MRIKRSGEIASSAANLDQNLPPNVIRVEDFAQFSRGARGTHQRSGSWMENICHPKASFMRRLC